MSFSNKISGRLHWYYLPKIVASKRYLLLSRTEAAVVQDQF